MKTFEDAVKILRINPRDERLSAEVQNMQDLVQEVLSSTLMQNYFEFLSDPKQSKKTVKRMGLSKRDRDFSMVLTAFVSGVRVGQEMEKS